MFIESDKSERRVHEAVGVLTNDKSFKREGQIDRATEGGPLLVWHAEPNGWDDV